MRTVQRVLGYCRVSGAEQGRTGTSLQGQREEIEQHCRLAGLPKPTFYVEVESAAAEKLAQRRVLGRLMSEARAGDLVIVSKQDRWSRDTLFYLKSVHELTERGCGFFSIAERFDPATPEGRFAATVMAAVAEHERARIYERTVGRRRQLRDQGCYIEGLPPIGYRRENRKLVVEPAEVPMVAFIFERCVEGESLSAIAAECRLRWPERSSWDKTTVHDLLRNRHLLGEVRTTDDRWQPSHPPIVDRATFARAARALESRRVGGRRHQWGSRTDAWLLRGLLRCKACGRRIGAAYSPNADYYACGGRIRRKGCTAPYARVTVTDDVVAALVLRHLAGLRDELAVAPAETIASVDYRPARARLERKRERLVDLAADGTITRAELAKRLDAITAELARIDEREADSALLARATSKNARAVLLADLRALKRAWRRAPVQQQRRIVEQLVEAIDLDAGTPRITWKPLAQLLTKPGTRSGDSGAAGGSAPAVNQPGAKHCSSRPAPGSDSRWRRRRSSPGRCGGRRGGRWRRT
jgi:site-specific DNA recombinase